MESPNIPVETFAPKVFEQLADYYHLSPGYLAFLILGKFCEDPPKSIRIISRDVDESER